MQQAALQELKGPTRYDLQFLKSWFERPKMGSFPLLGLDRTSWEAAEEELVGVAPREATDYFTNWFSYKVMPTLHSLIGEKLKVRASDTSIKAIS